MLIDDCPYKYDSLECAKWMDENDQLRNYRSKFHHPCKEYINKWTNTDVSDDVPITYLCGCSLGLQPNNTRESINTVLEQWIDLAVCGYNNGQMPAFSCDIEVNKDIAKWIVGAKENEVATTANLSLNIHTLLTSFYRPIGRKCCIMIENGSFPTDYYAIESQIAWHGLNPKECIIEIKPRPGEWCLSSDDIIDAIRENADRLALIWLPGVHFITGQAFEMELISKIGHEYAKCPVGWDLAHSVGNMPLELHDWNIDFAVWCSYKYLNGSPGGVGGLFVHENHHHVTGSYGPSPFTAGVSACGPQLTGWWGHREETRFDLTNSMELAPGAAAYRISHPPQLSIGALISSIEIFKQCGGMGPIREKSVKLTGYLEQLLKSGKFALPRENFTIITPSDPSARGAQITINVHDNLEKLVDKLVHDGFIFDIRKPSCIRVAPVPLYNSFEDVYRFASRLFELQKNT